MAKFVLKDRLLAVYLSNCLNYDKIRLCDDCDDGSSIVNVTKWHKK